MSGRKPTQPPCCLAGGLTEGEHDTDCDQHPGNVRRRAARENR